MYWSWWELEGKPKNIKPETLRKLKFHKVSKLSSNAMSYHPHGDTAMEELIGREGQYWNNNVMAIVPQGSYGNLESSDPAAGRYIQAKMSEYMIDCFFDDFDKYCVPMKMAYDGESEEPEYLPAKYPHILFNPQLSGIGYGLASNIPPFNVQEVLEATIKLIKNRKSKILLIPDSPNGADIIDDGLFPEINKTGKGKFTLRASYEIDYQANTIRFTTLPLQTKSKQVIRKINDFRKLHVFEEITDIFDSTKQGEVNILIKLKSDANPDKILNQLFKKNTNLKMTYPIGITVIDDYKAYDYGIKELLLEWIEYRRDVVRSMFMYSYQITTEREHMVKVLVEVFNKDNIERTVKIAKNSKTRKDTIEKLMRAYKITSLQAATIADMHVYNFNDEYYKKYKQEEKDLKEEIKRINDILEHDEKIDEFIIGQLKEGIKKYGRPRKSKVIKEDDGAKENIPATEHLVGISESGYIKKVDIKKNSSIGSVSKTNENLTVMQINNQEDILVFDSTGRVSKISVSAIPDMKFEDYGIEVARYFPVQGKIIGVMKLPSLKSLKKADDELCIVFVTKLGFTKKVKLKEFKKISDYKLGVTLNDGDELASVIFAFDNTGKDIILSTNLGDGIRLKLKDIKTLGRQAKGLRQINLKENEVVVNASRIQPKQKLLCYVTSAGRIKLTETKYFPVMERKDEALSLITLVGNETLVGVSSVSKDDILMVYRKNSEPVEIKLSELSISTRVAKGEKLVKTPKGDSVVAYKIFQK